MLERGAAGAVKPDHRRRRGTGPREGGERRSIGCGAGEIAPRSKHLIEMPIGLPRFAGKPKSRAISMAQNTPAQVKDGRLPGSGWR